MNPILRLLLCAIAAAYITALITSGIDPSLGRVVVTFAIWWAIILGAARFYETEAQR